MTEKLKQLIAAAVEEANPFTWPKNKHGEDIEQRPGGNPPGSAKHKKENERWEKFAEYLLSDPLILAEAGLVKKEEWIDVMERLPGKKQYVLLFGEGGRQFTALFDNGEFWAYNPFGDELEKCEAVTHWQPLPAPPSQLKK